jgi:hypothetical protein
MQELKIIFNLPIWQPNMLTKIPLQIERIEILKTFSAKEDE